MANSCHRDLARRVVNQLVGGSGNASTWSNFEPVLLSGAALLGVFLLGQVLQSVTAWVRLLQARAIENQACVVGVNRVGRDPQHAYTGRSLIVDPHGEILADAGDRVGCISAELDLAALLEYRRGLPFLADMRSDPAKS